MKDGKDIMDDVRKWVGEREKEILKKWKNISTEEN